MDEVLGQREVSEVVLGLLPTCGLPANEEVILLYWEDLGATPNC